MLYTARDGEYTQLFALDLNAREARQLTFSSWDTYSGDWSPDGRWIATVANRGGSLQVWKIPASGGEAEALTFGNERVRHAFHSADGRWVYFQPSHRNIYRVPASGGEVQAVTTYPPSGLFIEEPAISPDGRFIVYCRSHGGSSLWLFDLEDRSVAGR